jgi:hypothetical protein
MASVSSGAPRKDSAESGSGQQTALATPPPATGVPVLTYDTAAEKLRDGRAVKATV